jgi:hypothetical protein
MLLVSGTVEHKKGETLEWRNKMLGREKTDRKEKETCDFLSSNFILRTLLLWIEKFYFSYSSCIFSSAIVYMYIFSRLCVSLIPSRTFSLLTLLLILLIQLIGPPVAGPFLLVRLNKRSKKVKYNKMGNKSEPVTNKKNMMRDGEPKGTGWGGGGGLR